MYGHMCVCVFLCVCACFCVCVHVHVHEKRNLCMELYISCASTHYTMDTPKHNPQHTPKHNPRHTPCGTGLPDFSMRRAAGGGLSPANEGGGVRARGGGALGAGRGAPVSSPARRLMCCDCAGVKGRSSKNLMGECVIVGEGVIVGV